MKAKLKKYTNEGGVVEIDGKRYPVKSNSISRYNIEDEVDVEIEKDNAYLKEDMPLEGEIRTYRIKSKKGFGFFLETGLPDDLFMPFSLGYPYLREGDTVVVKVLRDDKNRLFATTKIKDHFKNEHNYKENDEIVGTIYSINPKLGAFAVIDGNIDARLEPFEMTRAYQIGDVETFRVKSVKKDGKIDLSLRKRGHLQIDKDAVKIMDRLIKKPVIHLGDKSSPKDIFEEFKLSKQAFKRACGRLKKQGLIEINDNIVRRVER